MNVQEVLSKVTFYSQARANIKNDRNLSEQGKARASGNLEQSISLFRLQALDTLTKEWREYRTRFEDTRARRAEAEQAESERWNYEKLNYELQSVNARLKAFETVQELGSWLETELNSGNLERARAVAEVVPQFARHRFPGIDGERVARVCERRLAVLLDTPEIQRVREINDMRVKAVLQLVQDTERVRAFFEPAFVWNGSEFERLIDSVRITRQYHPDEPERFEEITVEFVGSEPVSV